MDKPYEEPPHSDAKGGLTEDASHSTNATFQGEVIPLREIQRLYAAWAYEQLGGKKVLTAEKLRVDFRTLSKLLTSNES